jgi:hypothetical protein
MKIIPFIIASKKSSTRSKLHKGCELPLQGELQISEERD